MSRLRNVWQTSAEPEFIKNTLLIYIIKIQRVILGSTNKKSSIYDDGKYTFWFSIEIGLINPSNRRNQQNQR